MDEIVFIYEMEAELTIDIKKAYEKERHRLLAFIRSKIESVEDAEDILQDVFYQTLESISVTKPVENIVGWLFMAAKNKIIDSYRKKRLPVVSAQQEAETPGMSLENMLSELRFNPEHEFYRNLLIEELTNCLDELPEAQRMVFLWNVVEGRPFKEISRMTGDSINTLLSRKRYAIQYLRSRLKDINDILNEMQ
jgi:RNA polymerase sigma factor (sigma-70 family)